METVKNTNTFACFALLGLGSWVDGTIRLKTTVLLGYTNLLMGDLSSFRRVKLDIILYLCQLIQKKTALHIIISSA